MQTCTLLANPGAFTRVTAINVITCEKYSDTLGFAPHWVTSHTEIFEVAPSTGTAEVKHPESASFSESCEQNYSWKYVWEHWPKSVPDNELKAPISELTAFASWCFRAVFWGLCF